MQHYQLYGIHLACSHALPGLAPLSKPNDAADLTLSIAAPETVACSDRRWFHREFCDDRLRLTWHELFRFDIDGCGTTIQATPHPGVPLESLAVYLLGQVLAVALTRQGHEVLHGAAVEHGGQALIIMGDSGRGKSTLSAALWAQGWKLLTDDLVLPARSATGEWRVAAGPARLKLHRDSATQLQANLPAPLALMHPLTDKAVYPIADERPATAPIAGIICLGEPDQDGDRTEATLTQLKGRAAFQALVANNFNILEWDTRRGPAILSQATALIRDVPVWQLNRTDRLEDLIVTARLVGRLVGRKRHAAMGQQVERGGKEFR